MSCLIELFLFKFFRFKKIWETILHSYVENQHSLIDDFKFNEVVTFYSWNRSLKRY
jgi:hypothetical protein